jgi:hypothetical protein
MKREGKSERRKTKSVKKTALIVGYKTNRGNEISLFHA